MLKVQALVSRVSTDIQREKGLSIPRQKKWLEEEAKKLKFKNPEHYTDNGYSATDLNRPAYSRLINDIKTGVIDTVVVYKYDRIARNVIHLLSLIDLFKEHDIGFISITERFDTTTPTGKVMMVMAGSLAQWEREMTIERVKDAMWDKAKKGEFCGGQPPYGYVVKEKNIIPSEEETKIVKLMFDKFEESKSFRGICHWLNKSGHLTKRGTTWAQSTVRRIITNSVYKGYYTYGKRANSSSKYLPRDKWLIQKGKFEPIISEDQFERVQATIRQRKYIKPTLLNNTHLLVGLLKCGECGGSMCVSYSIKPQGTKYVYYKCNNYRSKGTSVCEGTTVRMDFLDGYILDEINKYAIQFDQSETENILIKKDDVKEELNRINKTIGKLTLSQERILSLFEDGSISRDILVKRMDNLTTSLDRARLQKDKILSELNGRNRKKRVDALQHINNLEGNIKSFPKKIQKDILRQLIKEVRYHKTGRVDIDLYEL